MYSNSYESLLEQIFKKYQPMLVAYSNSYLHSVEDAKGVVQEVFIGVWRNIQNVDKNKIKAYLFTATRNRSISFIKRQRLPTNDVELQDIEHRLKYDGEQDMDVIELQAIIFDEVNRLPPKCKKIFLLSRQEQLSYKEIAAQLGISTKTIENQINIALKRIRKCLEVYNAAPQTTSMEVLLSLALSFYWLGDL
ncbi:MAG: RNA polymerase sigma-70 factor [Aureispira sp.]|nr:RNA polymerase sigma-70 factor [Aureispira sp.]